MGDGHGAPAQPLRVSVEALDETAASASATSPEQLRARCVKQPLELGGRTRVARWDSERAVRPGKAFALFSGTARSRRRGASLGRAWAASSRGER